MGIPFLIWADDSPVRGTVKVAGGFRMGSDGAGSVVLPSRQINLGSCWTLNEARLLGYSRKNTARTILGHLRRLIRLDSFR